MNIVYSSDENYVQHLCVSMVSLFENNYDVKEMSVYVVSNDISEESKKKLSIAAKRYERELTFIEFEPYKKKLILDMEWNISISSYARLFLAEMLPEWCNRVIYIDCDTIVCNSLNSLYSLDMQGASVAGVNDLILGICKEKVGLKSSQKYINAGILLIDLEKWRKEKITETFLDFVNTYKGKVTHHDQGTINGTLSDTCMLLEPKYNVMTPFYTQKYNRMLKFYHINNYYSEEEVKSAKENPTIIHFTPGNVGRVWEYGCTHPKRDRYRQYLEMTPWRGNLLKAPKRSFKHKVLSWCEKKMPIVFIDLLRKFH